MFCMAFCPLACYCSRLQGLLVRHLQLVSLSVLALELVILLARSFFGDLPGYLHFPFVPVYLGFWDRLPFCHAYIRFCVCMMFVGRHVFIVYFWGAGIDTD